METCGDSDILRKTNDPIHSRSFSGSSDVRAEPACESADDDNGPYRACVRIQFGPELHPKRGSVYVSERCLRASQGGIAATYLRGDTSFERHLPGSAGIWNN